MIRVLCREVQPLKTAKLTFRVDRFVPENEDSKGGGVINRNITGAVLPNGVRGVVATGQIRGVLFMIRVLCRELGRCNL